MRIVHLQEVLRNPERFCLVVWDAAAGRFIERTEWIVHTTDNNLLMVERLQAALRFFLSKQCVGVTRDVDQILAYYGVTLPPGWISFQIR